MLVRWRRFGVLLFVPALLLAACGGDDGEDAGGDPGGQAAPRGDADQEFCTEDRMGGQITVQVGGDFSGMDPHQLLGSGVYGGDFAQAFYDSVIRYDEPSDSYEPALAESWEANEDNSEWTVRLRDDATFGNGDPFTAAHIEAHIERMRTSRSHGNLAELITGTEIVDDHEIVLTTDGPFSVPYLLATELGWVPNMNLVQQRGDQFHVNPVGAGAGAFEFQSLSATRGESLVLAAKDDWWGGPVCLERIEFTYTLDPNASVEAFLNGESDAILVNTIEGANEIQDADLLRYRIDAGTMNYITANQGRGGRTETPFRDRRVREAMQLAIDYDVLHERLADGLDPAPTSALLPETSPVFHGMEGPPHDPDRARELVQELIDEGAWDGRFSYLHSTRPDITETAVLLEGMWESVGMDVTLEADPDSARRVLQGEYDVAALGFGIVPPQPWATVDGLTCDSPRQRSGFCDPDMDAAIAQLRQSVTTDEVIDALGAVQEVWNREFPLITSAHGVWGIGAQDDLRGLQFGADNAPYYARAWLDG